MWPKRTHEKTQIEFLSSSLRAMAGVTLCYFRTRDSVTQVSIATAGKEMQ